MLNADEIYYTIALTRMTGFNQQMALQLYLALGSGQAVYEHRNDIGDVVPDSTPRLREAMKHWDDALKRAAAEMAFIEQKGIKALTLDDEEYPQRMRECPDAPIVLYYTGNADLNQAKVISIVGTRQITAYGQDLIRRFISELRAFCPQVLIVSGLAYGVDINAHRQALENGYETVGVLAHGLDQIYPYRHRDTAAQMLNHGGLLTEFMSLTNADKPNFVRRNRIVAGMADSVILIESAAKGGGLITAEIAQSYARSVFAFPGNVGQPYSEGCNNLIRDNGAGLISSAQDFVKAMGWWEETHRQQAFADGIERNLFPDLTPEEQQVVSLLKESNDLQLNIITVKTGIPIGRLTALLFQLEMKGVVKPLAGGMYHLIL
jgi:DNA processing protein